MPDYNLTRAEIDAIVKTVEAEIEAQRKSNGHSHCSTCGAPLPRKYDVPMECDECLKDLAIPEFLKQ